MRVYLIYQKAYTALEKHAYNEIKIFSTMKHDKHFLYLLSEQLLRHERINETLGVKKQLYTLAPTSSLSCDIGMIHLYKHERDSAEYYFKQAKEMPPNHVLPFYGLWLIAKDKNEKEQCIQLSKTILALPARVINNTVLKARKEVQEYLKTTNHETNN